MIIIGIDPGSRITGYGLIDWQDNHYRYVASGSVKCTGAELGDKLQQIFGGLQEIIGQYRPVVAAVEQVFMHRNVNSALKLGQARGAAIAALGYHGVSVVEYSARAIKKTVVGFGAADKAQMQYMMKTLLGLSQAPPPDPADALAVAICHAEHLRFARFQQPQIREEIA